MYRVSHIYIYFILLFYTSLLERELVPRCGFPILQLQGTSTAQAPAGSTSCEQSAHHRAQLRRHSDSSARWPIVLPFPPSCGNYQSLDFLVELDCLLTWLCVNFFHVRHFASQPWRFPACVRAIVSPCSVVPNSLLEHL